MEIRNSEIRDSKSDHPGMETPASQPPTIHSPTIENWRTRIDALDLQIVELLNQRAAAARAIGKLKEATDMPVYEPNREQIIFDNVCTHNGGPLPDTELVFIYQRVIAVMRCLQRNELASEEGDRTK